MAFVLLTVFVVSSGFVVSLNSLSNTYEHLFREINSESLFVITFYLHHPKKTALVDETTEKRKKQETK